MESNRRESLNPDFVQRLSRIQTAQMCRFCLGNNRLINIIGNDRIQMLISECYHGCLGTLNGNVPRFVCTKCYRRLEQSYEFLLLANRVQAQVDTYTFHDGRWPRELLLDDSGAQPGEKRIASPDEMVLRNKRVRFEDTPDDESGLQLGEPSSLESDRCDTPGNFENSAVLGVGKSESSLERTLSGEITGSELFQIYGSSSSGSTSLHTSSPTDDDLGTIEATTAGESEVGEVSKDPSMVHSLCRQIQAIGVGSDDRNSDKESFIVSKEDTINSRSNSNRREDG